MKTYNEFLTDVKECILDIIPNSEDLEILIKQTLKPNGITLDTISIASKTGSSISPVIYINQFYEQYQQGHPFNNVLDNIVNFYLSNKDVDFSSLDIDLTDKEKIIVNVINKEMNEKLLVDTPHIEFHDLAIVFRYIVDSSYSDKIGTILLKDNMLEGVDLNELLKKAIENTKNLLGVSVQSLLDVMYNLLNQDECSDEMIEGMTDDDTLPMYVISNLKNINGSAIILMDDIFEDLANKFDSDIFILPSSIHELLLVPTVHVYNDHMTLKDMVQSVNDNEVSISEQLSNNVYVYRRNTNKVEMCI